MALAIPERHAYSCMWLLVSAACDTWLISFKIANDAANWHSEMKKVARQIVTASYTITPDLDDSMNNQDQFFEATKRNVRALIAKDSYHKDGRDSNVSSSFLINRSQLILFKGPKK
jgi:hypothetical protein